MQCGFPDSAVAATVGQVATTSGPSHQRPVLSSAARNQNQARDSESEPDNESESEAYDSESEEADMALFHQFRARQAATTASAAVRQNSEVKNKREMQSVPVQNKSMAQMGAGQTPGVKSPCFASTMGGDMESEVGHAVRVVKQVSNFSCLLRNCVSTLYASRTQTQYTGRHIYTSRNLFYNFFCTKYRNSLRAHWVWLRRRTLTLRSKMPS